MLLPVSASWTIKMVQPTMATRPFQFCSSAQCQQHAHKTAVDLQLASNKARLSYQQHVKGQSLKLQAHLSLGCEDTVLKRLLPGETLQTRQHLSLLHDHRDVATRHTLCTVHTAFAACVQHLASTGPGLLLTLKMGM